MKIIYFALCVLIGFVACKKVEHVGTDPILTFESLNQLEFNEFKDSVVVLVSYFDGNGDLGRENPDETSLYVKDLRLKEPDFYHIPPILDSLQSDRTRGKMRIIIPSLFLLGKGTQEKTILSFKVKDQAGNWSNLIETPLITINKN